jgi:hypothetical protein
MTAVSARKLAANRANARASTGPRTAAGKASSARNAVRHGLCSKPWGDPEVGRAIERWARRFAGEATGEKREFAYRIAVLLNRATRSTNSHVPSLRVTLKLALVRSGA